MYDCGIPSSSASSTQQSEERRRGCRMGEAIEIVIMNGSGWPPAPPLFNNPIITGSILTGDPSAAAARLKRCLFALNQSARHWNIRLINKWTARVSLLHWITHGPHWHSLLARTHERTHIPVNIVNGDIIPMTYRWRQCSKKHIDSSVKGRQEQEENISLILLHGMARLTVDTWYFSIIPPKCRRDSTWSCCNHHQHTLTGTMEDNEGVWSSWFCLTARRQTLFLWRASYDSLWTISGLKCFHFTF